MVANIKAIEVEGVIDDARRLLLVEPLPEMKPSRVRVIILVPEEADEIDERSWLRAASSSDAFAFLDDAEENIYTAEDGKPYHE